jgi:hypothetical protein
MSYQSEQWTHLQYDAGRTGYEDCTRCSVSSSTSRCSTTIPAERYAGTTNGWGTKSLPEIDVLALSVWLSHAVIYVNARLPLGKQMQCVMISRGSTRRSEHSDVRVRLEILPTLRAILDVQGYRVDGKARRCAIQQHVHDTEQSGNQSYRPLMFKKPAFIPCQALLSLDTCPQAGEDDATV